MQGETQLLICFFIDFLSIYLEWTQATFKQLCALIAPLSLPIATYFLNKQQSINILLNSTRGEMFLEFIVFVALSRIIQLHLRKYELKIRFDIEQKHMLHFTSCKNTILNLNQTSCSKRYSLQDMHLRKVLLNSLWTLQVASFPIGFGLFATITWYLQISTFGSSFFLHRRPKS